MTAIAAIAGRLQQARQAARVTNTRGLSQRETPIAPASDALSQRRWEGYSDKVAGLAFRRDYDTWRSKSQRAYERGRVAATMVLQCNPSPPPWPTTQTFVDYLLRNFTASTWTPVLAETDRSAAIWRGK